MTAISDIHVLKEDIFVMLNLRNVDFTGVRFSDCNFKNSEFYNCDFKFSNFKRCLIDVQAILPSLPSETKHPSEKD